jgi:hypothetical protein
MPTKKAACGGIVDTLKNRDKTEGHVQLTIEAARGCGEFVRFGIEYVKENGDSLGKTFYGEVPSGPDRYGPVPGLGKIHLLCPDKEIQSNECEITYTWDWCS